MNRIKFRPKLNSVLALGFVICLFALTGICFDFYYDLNDDVLIKDILAGAYTGTPDAHCIQMLYPISLIISLLYKAVPTLPWMGIFLCGAHGLCFYLLAKRSLQFITNTISKLWLLFLEFILIVTLFLWELVMVQYTVTAAMLAATACFLVFTAKQQETWKSFLKEHAGAILLVILAFNVRSEMLLLMCPFIAFTGIVKWSGETKIFSKENWKKYLSLIGMIGAGMLLSLLVDMAAYSSLEWKTFLDFFNARTKVYDYTWYPDYEEAEEFYRELGVTEAKQELIDNYNFGLDESIDANLLWSIADYAQETGIKEPLSVQLKNALIDYKWRMTGNVDVPYSYLIIAAYGMVLALAILRKDKTVIWKMPLLIAFRSVPWMYVIWAKRVPNRISHPLYCIELVLLCAWMLCYLRTATEELNIQKTTGMSNEKITAKKTKNFKRALTAAAAMLGVFTWIYMPGAWQSVQDEMERRESVNATMESLDAYARQNPDNYYYVDVYSSVAFSEKIFENVNNTQKNYDILGGWAFKSPLQAKTTQNYREDDFSTAELLLKDSFYFVIKPDRDLQFLYDFYATQNVMIETKQTDSVGTDEGLLIFSIVPSPDEMSIRN